VLVRDVMTEATVTDSTTDTLRSAAERMWRQQTGSLLVMQNGRLAGILTERDMLRAVATGYGDDAKVGDWMTAHPETIEADDSTDHAAALMIHGGFRHLPVVGADRLPLGIVSIRDLMRVTVDDETPRGA